MSTFKVRAVKYSDRKNLVLRWTDANGNPKTKTSGTPRRREAERAAVRLEADLHNEKHEGPPAITWRAFRRAYERDYLAGNQSPPKAPPIPSWTESSA